MSRDLPGLIEALPRDRRGIPIPWFAYIDKHGFPDFRITAPGKVHQAVADNLCWNCGKELGQRKTFVVGPMAAISRIVREPPSHTGCARFAASACPFLSAPRMRGNGVSLPEGSVTPGAVAIWVTQQYRLRPIDNGVLFIIGEPTDVEWLTLGRPASRKEVVRALSKGMPFLLDEARDEGEHALRHLMKKVEIMRGYLPPEEQQQGVAAA